jgi:predicted Zn-dependent protease
MKPEQRLEAFKQFVAKSPDDPFARYSLAMSHRSLGQMEDAARELEELGRRNPQYVPTWLMLGQVLEGLGRRDAAARAYENGVAVATRAGDDHTKSELGQALEALRAQGNQS